jgi:hypothetical protein
MKRMLILAALVMAASVYISMTRPSDANATIAAAPTVAATVSDTDLIARENQVWNSLKRKDYDGFASFLTDDFVEVEANGVFDKAGSIKGVKEVDLSSTMLSDFKVLKLDNDASVVSYLVKGAQPLFTPEGERHSTVWVKRGGKWLALFHQGTPVAKM